VGIIFDFEMTAIFEVKTTLLCAIGNIMGLHALNQLKDFEKAT